MPPEIGENSVLDSRYRLLQKIGSGGMADVWLAEDTHLQRRVALKVLHRHFAQDREFVERFRREAEAAAGLQHPNIVAVYDRGEVEGTFYIAMQLLEGHSLKELIDAGLSPEHSVLLIRQVLEAAGFAHRHGIVHRDLKPQNVIVDAEGKATVTDFGIARAGASEITQTGSVMGTPHYLSPEQAQGMDVTSVSDLYSIGVMLYEALTGPGPVRGRLGGGDRDEAGLAGAAAPELDQPAGLAGARRGRDAGPREGPGPALPERRSLHRRPRRGAPRPRRPGQLHRGVRAAAAGRRHRRRGGRRARPRGGGAPTPTPLDHRRRRRGDRDRRPARPLPHPRHDHERARRDRELAPAGRTAPRKPGIRNRRQPQSAERSGGRDRPRAGTAARRRLARLRLPRVLLLEAGGGPHRQHRSRQRHRAEHRRPLDAKTPNPPSKTPASNRS